MRAMTLLLPIAGLLGWGAVFALVYGLHGIGCANEWHLIEVGPTNVQRAVQVGTWLAGLPPLAALAFWLRRRRLSGASGLLAQLSETSAWVGLAATVLSLFPVMAASVCI
jgi:hypothetical protein